MAGKQMTGRDNRSGVEQDFNRLAEALIANDELEEARALLESAIREMPAGWRPVREGEKCYTIAFWNREEFFAYVDHHAGRLSNSVTWIPGSYSQAWYQLAQVANEEERFQEALFCLDRGLELEPDHPGLWCEKGYSLGRLKRPEEALECFERAATVRDWAPDEQLARALRGQGTQLIDLERLDEAQAALERSLEFEPDSEVAGDELKYIADMRRARAARKCYEDTKRDLLCEPIFKLRAHRRIAEMASGRKTVAEVREEMRREDERKPQ